ncbi:Protein of unknown function [Paenibacillaceae bacterium GAS479]|nr:Protein of unknown function [Paenibacillaceae bacterium GAS479]
MGAKLRLDGRVETLAVSSVEAGRDDIGGAELLAEIREAHRDWINAQYHFEQALGSDQIDYAVYAIEATQRRYEMLLRQAKRLGTASPEWKGGIPR